MSKFQKLIEEAEVILASPEAGHVAKAFEDPKYMTLLRSIQGLKDNVQLSRLSGEELFSIKSMLKIVIMSATMAPSAAQRQLRAVYTAEVKQALLQIDAGHAVVDALADLVDAWSMVGPQA